MTEKQVIGILICSDRELIWQRNCQTTWHFAQHRPALSALGNDGTILCGAAFL